MARTGPMRNALLRKLEITKLPPPEEVEAPIEEIEAEGPPVDEAFQALEEAGAALGVSKEVAIHIAQIKELLKAPEESEAPSEEEEPLPPQIV